MNDPDVLWARFSAHVRSCEACTPQGECAHGHALGEAWYRADHQAVLRDLSIEMALDDGTCDRDEPAPWRPEV